MGTEAYIIAALAVLAAATALWRHQRALRQRAELMQEAIRNRDFTFRLPTGGLLPGERSMQETLNSLGTTLKEQLSRNEVEAWERLTRVMTHEIMNAMAPIASISQSLMSHPDVVGSAAEEGIRAIHHTSGQLMTFVDSYRKLSQLQEPQLAWVDAAQVARQAGTLFPQLHVLMATDGPMEVCADEGMLRQILANLMKNAVEAGATTVVLSAGRQQLTVGNDGSPIPAADRPSIFLPFFTTKRQGSGIGLALSRRMMVQQGGMMELAEKPLPGCRVAFVLTWLPR